MAPVQPYYGPIGMVDSRYASPQRRKQVEALLATKPELLPRKNAKNSLAFSDQAMTPQGVGVQLAQAQNRALTQEITQHIHAVDQTVSTIVAKIRQIMNSISYAIKRERPETPTLKVVGNLQQELDKLVDATRQAQGALPYFLQKQKGNSDLVAGAKIDQAHRDIQQELDQKEKSIKLGQDLVYGQQQALKDVEIDASNKIAEQQERISRLQMDLGLVRSEIETQKAELQKAKAAEHDAAKMRDVLDGKLASLIDSKENLSAENEHIRGGIKGLEAKLQAAEDKSNGAAEDYEKKLLEFSSQLQKEQQKVASLDIHIKTLRQADETSRREADKVKAESKLLSNKYSNQSTAYAKISEDLKAQTKKVDTLNGEVRALQQQKTELEKAHNRVASLKDSLQKQLETLTSELDELKQKAGLAKEEAQQLSSKLKRAESENDELEMENNDLRAKQLEHNKTVAALRKGDAEMATLRATVQSMQNKPTAINGTADVEALQQELRALKEEFSQSEANRVEWEKLGRKAMIQYRDIAPKCMKLESVEQQLRQVLVENQEFKAKRTTLTSTSGANGDAKYWSDKYHELLVEMEK